MQDIIANKSDRDGHTIVSHEPKFTVQVESNIESKASNHRLASRLVSYSDSSEDSAEEVTNASDLHGNYLKE